MDVTLDYDHQEYYEECESFAPSYSNVHWKISYNQIMLVGNFFHRLKVIACFAF